MSGVLPLSILVVDDDPDQRAICRASLRQGIPGVEVLCAGDGDECLAVADSRPLNVVVLDYMMPGMDGIQVLRRLHREFPDLVIIVATGCGDEAVAVEAMKQGATDYVMKSLDYHAMLPAVLRRALDVQRQKRELEEERTRGIQLATIVQTTRALAHEINNPLQVIASTCEVIAAALTDRDPALAQQAGEMMGVCERISDVIRRLHAVTTPVTEMRMGLQVLDINASVQPAVGGSAET